MLHFRAKIESETRGHNTDLSRRAKCFTQEVRGVFAVYHRPLPLNESNGKDSGDQTSAIELECSCSLLCHSPLVAKSGGLMPADNTKRCSE